MREVSFEVYLALRMSEGLDEMRHRAQVVFSLPSIDAQFHERGSDLYRVNMFRMAMYPQQKFLPA